MSRGVEGRGVGKGLGSPGSHSDSVVVDGGDGVGFTVKSEHFGGLSEGGEGSGDMAHSPSLRMMGGAEGRAVRLSLDAAQGGGGEIVHLEGGTSVPLHTHLVTLGERVAACSNSRECPKILADGSISRQWYPLWIPHLG